MAELVDNNLPVIKLTLFLKNEKADEQEIKVHDQLIAAGFNIFVDNVHGKDFDWFKKSYPKKTSRFFYILKKRTVELELDQMDQPPSLVAYFSDGVRIEEYGDWYSIVHFIHHILMGEKIAEADYQFGALIVLAQKNDIEPREKKEVKVIKTEEMPDNKGAYALRTFPVEARDAKFFELWKPHCDKPYTVMVKPYSIKGDVPFFSTLFASSSWGVSRLDAEFLKHVWKDMGFETELDLDELIKKHVEECTPSETNPQPLVEPVVHRATIEEVLLSLAARDAGLVRTKRMMDEKLKTHAEIANDDLY